jgi:hypothetical protein
LIAAGTSNAGLLAGCCVDLPVHAVSYTNMRIALVGSSWAFGAPKWIKTPQNLVLNTKGLEGLSTVP